jgi:folate-binding protein YgfZ
MTPATLQNAILKNRNIIRLAPLDSGLDSGLDVGEDVAAFLQGLVTQDVTGALPVWAALLTPQGKVLFDFMVWGQGDDLLLDCEAAVADALIKRLSLYKLRRKISITLDDNLAAYWSIAPHQGASPDPRLPALGWRWLADASDTKSSGDAAYLAHRLSLGVAEGQGELGNGEILWLECNAAELHGVSFTKGCYVGQENTARMNWRQKINRRLVVLPIAASNIARQRMVWPELGLALDHSRVEDISPDHLPEWLILPE